MISVVLLWFNIYFVIVCCVKGENVLRTEVFAIPIDPTLFNWTFEGINDQFVYTPSLLNSPDLPSWMNYVYSPEHHSGYLYGVPPTKPHLTSTPIEIVALNRKTYETRRMIVPIRITEKLNPARRAIQLKIDNLNVEDMFDVERMERLKEVFRRKLWKDSQNDLYVTFMASAVKLGARLPLRPQEGEGVVIRLGSIASLSNELLELQEEVKPLWKVPSCPRDFKRTTVERLFRENGFALDWCSFRLFEDQLENEELVNNAKKHELIQDRWISINRTEVPMRNYKQELAFTLLVPLFLMVVFGAILSLVLCLEHEQISKHMESTLVENPTVNSSSSLSTTLPKQTHHLRSLTTDITATTNNYLNPMNDVIGFSTNSPVGTLNRGLHCRPSPPPYVRPKHKINF